MYAPLLQPGSNSMYFAGEKTEISVAEVTSVDPDHRITTAGYTFDTNVKETSTAFNISTPQAYSAAASDTAVTYGMEWRRNGDIVVYVDGRMVHILHGSDWNPGNVVEEVRLMVDLSLSVPEYGDPALVASESVEATIEYIAVWKMSFVEIITPTATAPEAELPNCTCKEKWSHGAVAHFGCASTPDNLYQSWCYTNEGECHGSSPSIAFQGWHWAACDKSTAAAKTNVCASFKKKRCKNKEGVCQWQTGRAKGCYEDGKDLPCNAYPTWGKCKSSAIEGNNRCMWWKSRCIDSPLCDPEASVCCGKRQNMCRKNKDVCSWVRKSVCVPRPEIDGSRLALMQPTGSQQEQNAVLGGGSFLVQPATDLQKSAAAVAGGASVSAAVIQHTAVIDRGDYHYDAKGGKSAKMVEEVADSEAKVGKSAKGVAAGVAHGTASRAARD